jgi:hypothetical protein
LAHIEGESSTTITVIFLATEPLGLSEGLELVVAFDIIRFLIGRMVG